MAIPAILMAAGRLALQGLSKSKVVKELAKKYKDFSDDVLQDAATKGAKAAKLSEKTGKPIKEFYKEMLPTQTGPKKVAAEGIKKGVKGTLFAASPIAGYVVGEKAYDKAIKVGEAKAKSKKDDKKRKQFAEHRGKVMSETKLNKGGVIKANAGASVPPNRMSRK
tara:strand:- start:245 stop:739 length:495 start_codon:yes stop_codon:yes gene_type:complete